LAEGYFAKMEYLIALVVFWGVWLLIPLVVDGITTLYTLISVSLVHLNRARRPTPQLQAYPLVSIIIPVYNSEVTLEACLHSIAAQDYPLDQMEIHLINNGSSDRSQQIFVRIRQKLKLHMGWYSIFDKGKAWAMNAGIHMSNGAYIFNIDSDVVLAPDAVRRVVEEMEHNLNLGAVTGAIQVLPPTEDSSRLVSLLGKCEFFEYLTAFHVGREHQTLMQNIYTLSGAFSVFRRELLMQTNLYRNLTVTEDTDLTFDLHERYGDWQIACVSSAIAYVHPIDSLGALYAQRVRWQQGQIEVSAQHEQLMRQPMWMLRSFSPARTLLIDHTLAFPRIVWTFLLPILAFFGYPLSLIMMAFLVLYGFYLLIDFTWVCVAWLDVNGPARKRLLNFLWLLPVMPFYRMVVFWFRISGFLHAIAEPGTWRVPDPLIQLKQGLADLNQSTGNIFGRLPATIDVLQEKLAARKSGEPRRH
jgi:biofilm PGA synthesis N-glycosyltransferase PgaC